MAVDGIYRHLNLVQSRLNAEEQEPAVEQQLEWTSSVRPLPVTV